MSSSTQESVVKAWEDKLGTKDEFRIEEVTDVKGETVYHLISRNGSVTAAARSLEKLEAHAGEPFVEDLANTDFPAKPVELDNSDKKGGAWNQQSVATRDQLVEQHPDEPTKEEAERLNTGRGLDLSGNDTAGEFGAQDDTAGQEALEDEQSDLEEAGEQSGDEDGDGSLTDQDERVQ